MVLKSKTGTAAFFIVLAVLFLLSDRIFKGVALLASHGGFDIVGRIFRFQFARNYGIAFSIPLGGMILNFFVFVIICALIYWTVDALRKKSASITIVGSLLLIIAGALSNFFDRAYYGYVIDYLDLKYFTVFNLADIMIVGGVIILIKVNLFKKHEC